MERHEFRISEESLPALRAYAELPVSDPRRHQLFSFLAEAVSRPNAVAFETDDAGLRWTWLGRVALVWRVDLPLAEIDVIDVWDER